MSKTGFTAVGLLLAAAMSTPAIATISLDYAGAFKCGFTGINSGDIAYYPDGNGGAGSLFITEGASGTRKELNEVTIPALVATGNVADLNTATVLNSWDEGSLMPGLDYTSDGKLCFAKPSGNQGFMVGTVNTDGTGQTTLTTMSWMGVDQTVNFDVVDTPLVSGYDKIILAQDNNIHDLKLFAFNSSTNAKTTILQYDSSHLRTGYVASDVFFGAAVVPDGDDSTLIVSGKTNGENTLWFYHASDIVNAVNKYDPQPYATLSIEDKIFAPNGNAQTIYGLAYDSANNMLYATEGAYAEPNYVQAWSVVPEPATLALMLCGGLALYRRRRA